tara:strand:+ start:590 stop:790 length:201 start_codon:yes stop_codon:yes gene_type:complete
MNNWQQDTWADIETEEGELVDANLWTCDVSGRQYITFYPTTKNQQGFLETDTSVSLATYEVNLQND